MADRDKANSAAGSPPGGPLRRRMSEDMTVRGFMPCTQRGYIRQPFTTPDVQAGPGKRRILTRKRPAGDEVYRHEVYR